MYNGVVSVHKAILVGSNIEVEFKDLKIGDIFNVLLPCGTLDKQKRILLEEPKLWEEENKYVITYDKIED